MSHQFSAAQQAHAQCRWVLLNATAVLLRSATAVLPLNAAQFVGTLRHTWVVDIVLWVTCVLSSDVVHVHMPPRHDKPLSCRARCKLCAYHSPHCSLMAATSGRVGLVRLEGGRRGRRWGGRSEAE